jgi:hypothetical protein
METLIPEVERSEIIFCFSKLINYCIVNDIDLATIKLHFDDPQSTFYHTFKKCFNRSDFTLFRETGDPLDVNSTILSIFKSGGLLSSNYTNCTLQQAYTNTYKRYG